MTEANWVVHPVINSAGTTLALTQLVNNSDAGQHNPNGRLNPVLLAHGTFSNHRSVQRLATYLASQGFDCWMLDFQGHGKSDKPKQQPNFDGMCIDDAAASLDYLKTLYPAESIIWIGHSGGGLAALTLLCRKPEYADVVRALVTIGSQATHAAKRFKYRLIIQASRFITGVLRMAPGKYFKLGPENEFGPVMMQWYRWNLSGRWLSDDGFDYLNALPSITVPTLMLSGTGDVFIAPPEGCLALYERIGSSVKQYRECGEHTGFAEDYDHTRLVSSRNASREIWPLISDWLTQSGMHPGSND